MLPVFRIGPRITQREMVKELNSQCEMLTGGGPSDNAAGFCTEVVSKKARTKAVAVILNADDWGRDTETTDRELECVLCGAISSVSGMVFMEDSERAADLSCQRSIDTGLHLNLTQSFSGRCSSRLVELQRRISRFLISSRVAQVFFHPALVSAFEYVVRAQFEEYERLYGVAPRRIDGHHHMHLCGNIYFQKLLPEGAIVRRNFSFAPGEKNAINRWYRSWQDAGLARRHQVTDLFFSLPPLEPENRLRKIFALARSHSWEIETHPVVAAEYRFLCHGQLLEMAGDIAVAEGYSLVRGSDDNVDTVEVS
jgi:chitin disaccharide deacetylase